MSDMAVEKSTVLFCFSKGSITQAMHCFWLMKWAMHGIIELLYFDYEVLETGVIAYSTGQVLTSDTKISVPRLFRSGLGIITMGRP